MKELLPSNSGVLLQRNNKMFSLRCGSDGSLPALFLAGSPRKSPATIQLNFPNGEKKTELWCCVDFYFFQWCGRSSLSPPCCFQKGYFSSCALILCLLFNGFPDIIQNSQLIFVLISPEMFHAVQRYMHNFIDTKMKFQNIHKTLHVNTLELCFSTPQPFFLKY